MDNVQTNKGKALITLAAIVVVLYGMQAAQVLLVPFLLAVFLALITVRPMLWMQRRHVPSIVAALSIVLSMVLILALVGGIVGTSIAQFTAAIPGYQVRLDAIVARFGQQLADLLGEEQPVQNLTDLIDPGFAMSMAGSLLNALQDVLTNTFLITLTVIFILLEASSLGVKARVAFGRSAEGLERSRQFLHNLGRYLGIKTMVSLATGFLAFLVTSLIGVDFPLLWGMLAFVLNFVPTIGSIIAAVPAVLVALVQLGVGEATMTAIGFIGINILFGNFLEPRLMGYGVGISPLVVFVGLFFWGWIFGPVGMLLSVPLTMTAKMALENNEDTRWIAIMIGSSRDAEHELQKQRRKKLKAAVDDEPAPPDEAAA